MPVAGPPPRIRPMVHADLNRIMDIAASLPEAPQWPRSAYESALKPESVPPRITLVAELNQAACGFALASILSPQAELESIAVDRSLQGGGIGSALLAALIHEALQAGAEEMLLEVRASNYPAIKLYSAAGFREVGRRPRYYLNPPEDALLMQLSLRQSVLPERRHRC